MTVDAGTAGLGSPERQRPVPVQVPARVLSIEPVGAYLALALDAPAINAAALPGQFVALAVGGRETPMLLRRSFAIASGSRDGATSGAPPAGDGDSDVLRIVFAVAGSGTRWLAERRAGDVLDVVGPLGRPFPLPETPGPVALVGGGYGTAPLFPLADELAARGCDVHLVVGAATADRLYGLDEARRRGTLSVTTDDGSAGSRGRVTDVLPGVLDSSGAVAVYACGPMAMLRAVTEVAAARDVPTQVAVEESMACGIGVCMTCVLPVVGDDGVTRMVRSCVEGPVFPGDRVRFEAVGTVPGDAFGAPAVAAGAGGGH